MVATWLEHLVLASWNNELGDLLHLAVLIDGVQLIVGSFDVTLHLGNRNVLVAAVVQGAEGCGHRLLSALSGDVRIANL